MANNLNAIILSLDSLSIYKQIDIISAKPTKEELKSILHFGVDEVYPNEEFNASSFMKLYEKTKNYATTNNKNLIIVGGSGFYLKALLDGLSSNLTILQITKDKAKQSSLDLQSAYEFIKLHDSLYASKISCNDSFRLQKWFEIYHQYGLSASEFFKQNPPTSTKEDIELYEIEVDKEILKQKISLRTELMIQNGAIDEAFYLESTYTREPKCFNSIGIAEIFSYFDGLYNVSQLKEKISHNTYKLAKRQTTFNKTQFQKIKRLPIKDIKLAITQQHEKKANLNS